MDTEHASHVCQYLSPSITTLVSPPPAMSECGAAPRLKSRDERSESSAEVAGHC